MKNICIIIARGGSKRLYRKNVKMFCGKPLVEWSIIQARAAHLPIGIYLSTDDDEIAEIGERNGIEVIRRPDWPDADLYAANVPICHAIDEIKKQGVDFDTILHLFPTAACRHPDDIDKFILRYAELKRNYSDMKILVGLANPRETFISKKIDNNKAKCVLFSKKYEYMVDCPGLSMVDKDWYLEEHREVRYDSVVDDNVDRELIKKFSRIGGWPYCYFLCKWYQEYDIDDLDTFELCEIMMNRYILKGRGEKIYWDYKKGEGEAIRRAMEEIEK